MLKPARRQIEHRGRQSDNMIMKRILIFVLLGFVANGEQLNYMTANTASVNYTSHLRWLSLTYSNAFSTQNQLWYYQRAWTAGYADDGTSTLISAINTNRVWRTEIKWIDSMVPAASMRLPKSSGRWA